LQGITLTFGALTAFGLSVTIAFGIKSYEKTQRDINLILKNDSMRNIPIDGQIVHEILEKDTIPFLVISVEGPLNESVTLKNASITEIRTKAVSEFSGRSHISYKKRHNLTQSLELTPKNYGKGANRGKRVLGIIPGPEDSENVDISISAVLSNGYRSELITKTGELHYEFGGNKKLTFSYPQGTMWNGLPELKRDTDLYMEENYVPPSVHELQVSSIPIDIWIETPCVLGEKRVKMYMRNLTSGNIQVTKCLISVESLVLGTARLIKYEYFLKSPKYVAPEKELLILSTDVQSGTVSVEIEVSNGEVTRKLHRSGQFDLSLPKSNVSWEVDKYNTNSQLRDTMELFDYMEMKI